MEEVVNGAVQRRYTYGKSRISQNQFINGAWTPTFYGYDGQGSVRLLTNSAGTVTDTYDYDAWGNAINATGSTPNLYLYTGEQYDTDLGLYYLRARYFNPLTGRFLTRDPADGQIADPKSLHKYLYAGADPTNAFDPTGRNMFETGELLEVPFQLHPRAAIIGFCVNAILRELNYLFWHIGGVGQPKLSPIFCALNWSPAPWFPKN